MFLNVGVHAELQPGIGGAGIGFGGALQEGFGFAEAMVLGEDRTEVEVREVVRGAEVLRGDELLGGIPRCTDFR